MTVTEGPRPGRGDGLTMWLGHHNNMLWLGFAALNVAQDALGSPDGGPVTWLGNAYTAVFLYSLWAEFRVHNHRLCERCVASSPLDPQAAVGRWRPALRLVHARWVMGVVIAVLLARIVLGHVFRPVPWWLLATDAAVMASFGCFAVAYWAHRRLYPWCPWCHWGGGGDHEMSPDVPDPAMSK